MDTADLLERLSEQPGARELLAVAPPGSYLVGGAVRDLLLGRAPRELDVVLEASRAGPHARDVAREEDESDARPASSGGPARFAAELAARVRARGEGIAVSECEHERFDTASVAWDGVRIDIAAARRERYAAPGALPTIEPASLERDLLRRDFTVNALALALDDAGPRELRAAPGALQDLRAGVLRVLHEHSFSDDPTRLWRLARYRARLGFEIEERTAELAGAAVADGALATVSGARVGAELRLALGEADAPAALAALDELGLLAALHPRLRVERALLARALELLGSTAVGGGQAGRDFRDGDRPDLLLLATLALPLALRADGHPRSEIAALLERLEFTAAERDRVADAAVAAPVLIDALPAAASPSQLRATVRRVPPEGVALAGALSAAAEGPARCWLGELREVRLRIGGEDLLVAGVPQGPEIGRRLEETLRMRLDDELPDEHEAQLRAALALE
jgi:tRNA nucleotidyltransferase (CCA-adding enzyme)